MNLYKLYNYECLFVPKIKLIYTKTYFKYNNKALSYVYISLKFDRLLMLLGIHCLLHRLEYSIFMSFDSTT